MYERTYGEKYLRNTDVKEIAKLMRAEVKNSIKAGTIPKGTKVSITIERYSMGQSINMCVTQFNTQFLNAWRVKFTEDHPHKCLSEIPSNHPAHELFTPIAKRTLAELNRIHGLWNHDGSDSMTDYFDVNYYGDASFSYKIEGVQHRELKEKVGDMNWPASWENFFNY